MMRGGERGKTKTKEKGVGQAEDRESVGIWLNEQAAEP